MKIPLWRFFKYMSRLLLENLFVFHAAQKKCFQDHWAELRCWQKFCWNTQWAAWKWGKVAKCHVTKKIRLLFIEEEIFEIESTSQMQCVPSRDCGGHSEGKFCHVCCRDVGYSIASFSVSINQANGVISHNPNWKLEKIGTCISFVAWEPLL